MTHRQEAAGGGRQFLGGGGGGGRLGGGGAVVVVLQLQFIDKVVFVLLQLKFQQSWVCTGSSSTECWIFQLYLERGTHSANCAEDCSCVDVPVISSDKFPQRILLPLIQFIL